MNFLFYFFYIHIFYKYTRASHLKAVQVQPFSHFSFTNYFLICFAEDRLQQDSGECSICLEDMVKGVVIIRLRRVGGRGRRESGWRSDGDSCDGGGCFFCE